jgi:hypothetical protein
LLICWKSWMCSPHKLATIESLGIIFHIEDWRDGIVEKLKVMLTNFLGSDTIAIQQRHPLAWIQKRLQEIIGEHNFCRLVIRVQASAEHYYQRSLYVITRFRNSGTFHMRQNMELLCSSFTKWFTCMDATPWYHQIHSTSISTSIHLGW